MKFRKQNYDFIIYFTNTVFVYIFTAGDEILISKRSVFII